MVATSFGVDMEVFRRYAGLSLPRHVSYPMPTWWHDLSEEDVAAMYRDGLRQEDPPDLSLYIHVPFCETLCKFCACNKVIMRKSAAGASERLDAYVNALEREIVGLADTAGTGRTLRQLHWGGGTPTYLPCETIARIHETIQRVLTIDPNAEIAIEVDPRTAPPGKLRGLREIGFNRISMGVQDFDARVQEHVRRIQPFEMVRDTVAVCRELGFDSINFDLIYGLPYQTVDTIADTLERSISLSPDRVAYYHYAQIPEKIATQRGMDYTKLPDSDAKLQMFLLGERLFTQAGYDFIGLDHFARPHEMLTRSSRDGTLQRNFQGMTTGGGLDIIAAGVSSIGHLLGIGFIQNRREVDEYVACVETGRPAAYRGKRFTPDDLIRQAVMNQLYCMTQIRPGPIERRFGISFTDYFAHELAIMEELQSDGLVQVDPSGGAITVTSPLGRVLLRNVAAAFDAYLDQDAYRAGDRNCFSANA